MAGDDRGEVREKHGRIVSLLERSGSDAAILARKENFSWFTCGGDCEVVVPAESGAAVLAITRRKIHLVAHVMDGPRILAEEMRGMGAEYVPVRWHEGSVVDRTLALVKGMRALSDVRLEGTVWAPKEVQALHDPLTAREIGRLRSLGTTIDGVMREVADAIEPGMREQEAAGVLIGACGRLGLRCDVLLLGSDYRLSRYRHPTPTKKRIRRHVMLHAAVRQWGLHANVSRHVHFGPVSAELGRRYEAARLIEAASIGMCRPGTRFCDILALQKRGYAEAGYDGEWEHHFQGGVTGYVLADPIRCLDPLSTVSANQAYDWFVTITGVKVEELSLNTGGRLEVCSAAGNWPMQEYRCGDQSLPLPGILVR